MAWKLNADGKHDPKPIRNEDCVLGVLRSKTNILLPGVKSMPTNVTFYIQSWIQAPSILES